MTRPKVIFLNGAFGAGKTTAARALHALNREFTLYDPERVGIALQRLAPPRLRPEDFQSLGLWRTWAATSIELRAKSRPARTIVVPMTLIADASRQTIIGTARSRWPSKVLEVWLRVSDPTLHERLVARDGETASWALRQLGLCRDFERAMSTEIIVIDGEMTPAQIASKVRAIACQM